MRIKKYKDFKEGFFTKLYNPKLPSDIMDSDEFKNEFKEFIKDCNSKKISVDNLNLYNVSIDGFRLYHTNNDFTARFTKSNNIIVLDNVLSDNVIHFLKEYRNNQLSQLFCLCIVKKSKICPDLNMTYVLDPKTFISNDALDMITDCWKDFNFNYLDNQYELNINNEYFMGFNRNLYLSINLSQQNPSDIFNKNLDKFKNVLSQTFHLMEGDGIKPSYSYQFRDELKGDSQFLNSIKYIDNINMIKPESRIISIDLNFFGNYPIF